MAITVTPIYPTDGAVVPSAGILFVWGTTSGAAAPLTSRSLQFLEGSGTSQLATPYADHDWAFKLTGLTSSNPDKSVYVKITVQDGTDTGTKYLMFKLPGVNPIPTP